MVTLTVNIFERMWAWFTLFSFETGRVNLEVGLATPGKVAIMFKLVQPVALLVGDMQRWYAPTSSSSYTARHQGSC